MFTFFVVLISLSLLILGHEAGHFLTAKLFGLKVEEFGIGFPPRMFARKKGETEYSVNWLPFGGFVKIAGEDGAERNSISEAESKKFFFAQPAWKRAIVLGAGVFINFLLGWMLIAIVYMVGTPPILAVREVFPDTPAAAAGLKAGDLISGFGKSEDFINYVRSRSGSQAEFTVVREGKEIPFSIAPKEEEGNVRIGIGLEEGGAPRMNPFIAFWEALKTSGRLFAMTAAAIFNLIVSLVSKASLMEGVVGPVGIFSVANQTSQFGFIFVVQLMGLISINLAVANLIPFPALDGGRLFLVLIEKIKGSPVSKKVEMAINGVGFVFLILLMVLVTIRDVSNWIR